jgi:hypothetical protein
MFKCIFLGDARGSHRCGFVWANEPWRNHYQLTVADQLGQVIKNKEVLVKPLASNGREVERPKYPHGYSSKSVPWIFNFSRQQLYGSPWRVPSFISCPGQVISGCPTTISHIIISYISGAWLGVWYRYARMGTERLEGPQWRGIMINTYHQSSIRIFTAS